MWDKWNERMEYAQQHSGAGCKKEKSVWKEIRTNSTKVPFWSLVCKAYWEQEKHVDSPQIPKLIQSSRICPYMCSLIRSCS